MESTIDTGDTAWILISAALVMIMTPGVGFFYAGLVRSKNALATIGQSFGILAIASVPCEDDDSVLRSENRLAEVVGYVGAVDVVNSVEIDAVVIWRIEITPIDSVPLVSRIPRGEQLYGISGQRVRWEEQNVGQKGHYAHWKC